MQNHLAQLSRESYKSHILPQLGLTTTCRPAWEPGDSGEERSCDWSPGGYAWASCQSGEILMFRGARFCMCHGPCTHTDDFVWCSLTDTATAPTLHRSLAVWNSWGVLCPSLSCCANTVYWTYKWLKGFPEIILIIWDSDFKPHPLGPLMKCNCRALCSSHFHCTLTLVISKSEESLLLYGHWLWQNALLESPSAHIFACFSLRLTAAGKLKSLTGLWGLRWS